MPVIDHLKSSNQPHLYLLYVDLSRDDYDQTRLLSSEEKGELVKKIINHGSPDEIVQIIKKLAELEFSVAECDPIRTGNRLVGQLMRLYIEKKEKDRFFQYYTTKKDPGDQDLTQYAMGIEVKKMFAVVHAAAKQTLNPAEFEKFMKEGFHILPAFFYQQLIPQLPNRSLPVELTRYPVYVDQLNQQIKVDDYVLGDIPLFDLNQKLLGIKSYIKGIQWEVGGFLFFKGGVMYGEQRVPHRVNDILNLLEQLEGDDSKGKAREVYEQIIVTAKEAIDSPRIGRKSSTTQFYSDILNDKFLQENYVTQSNQQVFSVK